MPDTVEALPNDIVESVAIASLKSIAEQPAILANLALSNVIANSNLSQQNAVANQQAVNELNVAIVARVVNLLTSTAPGDPVPIHIHDKPSAPA